MNNLFFNLPILADSIAMQQTLRAATTMLMILFAVIVVLAVVLEIMHFRAHRRSRRKVLRQLLTPVYIVGVLILVFTIYCGNRMNNSDDIQMSQPSSDAPGSSNITSSVPTTSLIKQNKTA